MTYQVEGAITVDTGPDGETYATGTYTTNAYKAWNVDRDEQLQGVPFSGPADAAGFGLAQEFAVVGSATNTFIYR